MSDRASFRPLWQPKFLSALVPEDRCHLNGLAMNGEQPAYVTAVSRSDVLDGWRDRRGDGGIVIDVASGKFDYADSIGERMIGEQRLLSAGVVLAGRWWHPT